MQLEALNTCRADASSGRDTRFLPLFKPKHVRFGRDEIDDGNEVTAVPRNGYAKGLELSQELAHNKLQMDGVTYGTILAVCASNSKWEEAEYYFNQVKDEGSQNNTINEKFGEKVSPRKNEKALYETSASCRKRRIKS
ncbi:hypothetical protein Fmac_010155 [Flemingia macrophylla]|uniref:Uncharacterized protein n=1 Tax=Flemingia macrophylla TaxID=520843 RepID=A0ABD1N4T0_9FABA